MSTLSKKQMDEIESYLNSTVIIETRLIPRDELTLIGNEFPPSPDSDGKHPPGLTKRLKEAASKHISAYEEELSDVICNKWKFCEKHDQEALTLSIGVAEALLAAATSIPFPITAVSVYLVKKHYLNKLCHCSNEN